MSDVRLQDVLVRQLLQYAESVSDIAGCRPLIQIAVSPDVFRALVAEVRHSPEPGEPDEIRFTGGISVATFDAVSLREGWSDMLTGTGTLKRANDERSALRAALAEALEALEAIPYEVETPSGVQAFDVPRRREADCRIAELRAKHLGPKP